MPDKFAIAGLLACLRLLVCMLVLVSPMAAAGPQALRVDGRQPAVDLQPYISYLRDPAGSLQIEQVRQQAEQFRPASERRDLNFGYTHDHLWLSLDLVSTADQLSDWLIEMSYASLDRVSLYSVGADGIQVQHAGDTLAYGERSIGHRNPLFALRLDGFKDINDEWGHAVGDRVLLEVAARLQAFARGSDLVARLGGDEFILLSEGILERQEVLGLAERLLHVIGLPVALQNLSVSVGASIGISFSDGIEPDIETLMRQADQAMYQRKCSGKQGVVLYSS